MSLNFSSLLSSLIKSVSGTYQNLAIGYSIQLPSEWNGTELNVMTNMVIATPKDSGSFGMNTGQNNLEKHQAMMTVIGITRKTFDTLKNFTQTMMSSANSSSMMNMVNQYQKDAKCAKSRDSFITINGVTGQQIAYECKGALFAGKIEGYVFATKDHSLIITSFFGNSTSGYDKYLPQFEQSVKTLKISNPANIERSPIFREYQNFTQIHNQNTGG